MTMSDMVALTLLALVLGRDLSGRGLGLLPSAMTALALTAPLILISTQTDSTGTGLIAALGYILASRLSAIARGSHGVAELGAGLAAGAFAATGPLGVVCASSAIAVHAGLSQKPMPTRTYLLSAVLLFVPLTVLAAAAISAWIATGDPLAVGAGGDVFLRGDDWRPDQGDLVHLTPALIPLALLGWTTLRRSLMGPLALIMAGLVASAVFGTPALIIPVVCAALLATASLLPCKIKKDVTTSAALFALIAAALTALALDMNAAGAESRPLLAPWRIADHTLQTFPAWGVPGLNGARTPHHPPQIERRDNRYVLIFEP